MGSFPESELNQVQHRLLVTAIEEKAQWQPFDTFVRYAPEDWEKNGYKTINWSQFASAIDRVAYLLDERLGKSANSDVVGYFGPTDARYSILVPACIKTGRTLLILDGRVLEEGIRGLLTQTTCKTWLYAEDDARGPIAGTESIPRLGLPSLEWMLQGEDQKRYPYNKTFEQTAWDEIVIIHTSGTTGTPKPIRLTNGYWTSGGNGPALSQRHWPRGINHEGWNGKRLLTDCPPQWLAGQLSMLMAPVYFDCPCILPPLYSGSISPDLFKKILERNKIDGFIGTPFTISTLYENTETRAQLKKLKTITFLGAALDRAIGDDLCQYTRVTPIIGATETGEQISIRPADKMLWYTHCFVPENGSKMVPIDAEGSAEGLHELVLERSEDGLTNFFQSAFWNPDFKNLKRIELKELYTPIRDSDGSIRWIFTARKDDLTKLSWLAKFHAQDIEARLQQHPSVQSVLVGGEGRPCPYVLIEAKESVLDAISEEELLNEIYQTAVVGQNNASVKEIQIPKETVLLAKKERPFKRNLKQVVLRREVEKDYSEEIETAYERLGCR